MSINKHLCTNYDKDNKGYVTIGDMDEHIFYLSLTFVGFYTWFYGLYDYVFNGYTLVNEPLSTFTFTGFSHDIANVVLWCGIYILIIIIIVTVGIFFIFVLFKTLELISKIEIAKCELKSKK